MKTKNILLIIGMIFLVLAPVVEAQDTLQMWRNASTGANVSWVNNNGDWYMLGDLTVDGSLIGNSSIWSKAGTNIFPTTLTDSIGIGIAAPESLLHIFSSDMASSPTPNVGGDELVLESSGNTGMTIFSGTGSTGSILFGDDNHDIGRLKYDHSGNEFQFYTGGSLRMTLDGAGLGIGTATPAESLHVDAGSISLTDGTSMQGARIVGDATSNKAWMGTNYSLDTSSGNLQGFVRGARTSGTSYLGLEIGTSTNHPLRFITSGTDTADERMRIESGGDVGIGTTNPSDKLQVEDGSYGLTVSATSWRNAAISGINGRNINMILGDNFFRDTYSNAGVVGVASNDGSPVGVVGYAVGNNDRASIGATLGANNTNAVNGEAIGLYIKQIDATAGSSYEWSIYDASGAKAYIGGSLGVGDASPETKFDVDNGNVSFDAGAFYWNYNDNRLGVGTTAPRKTTHINGDNDDVLYLSGGVSDDVSISFDEENSGTVNAKIYWDASTNDFKFATSSADAMTIDGTNNNVGIGTTNPGSKLEVYDGLIDVRDPNGYGGLQLTRTGTVNDGDTTGYLYSYNSSNFIGGMKFIAHDTDDGEIRLRYKVAGVNTDAVTFVDGNVGIGTTSPTSPLDVVGVINSSVGVHVTADGTGGDFNGASLKRGQVYLNRDDTATVKQIIFYKNGAEHSYLETSTSGLNIGGGNVGIGTSNPSVPLEVRGNAIFQTDLDQDTSVFIKGYEAKNANFYLYPDQGDDNADKWKIDGQIGGNLGISNYATGAWSEYLTLEAGGKVGIGTTAPSAKLDVAGTIEMNGIRFDESFDYLGPVIYDPQAYIEAEFPNTPTGWSRNIGGFAENNSAEVPFSKVIRSTNYDYIYGDYVAVNPGDRLYGEAWAYRETGAAGTAGLFYFGIMRYDKDKKAIATNSGIDYFVASGQTVPSTSTWTKYTGYHTLPLTHTPYSGSDGGPVRYVRSITLINYNSGTIQTDTAGYIIRRVEQQRDSGEIAFNGNVGIGDTDPETKLDVDGGNVSFDAGAFYWNYNDDRLGIGTTTPGSQLNLVNTSTGDLAYTGFKIDYDIQTPAADSHGLRIGSDINMNMSNGRDIHADIIGESISVNTAGSDTTSHTGSPVGVDITITNNAGSDNDAYGLRINAGTPSTGNNYAIYSANTGDSYFAGNIGIGNSTPGEELVVSGSSPKILITDDYGSNNIYMGDTGSANSAAFTMYENGTAKVHLTTDPTQSGFDNYFLDANFGIGTASPDDKLDVSHSTATANMTIGSDVGSGYNGGRIKFRGSGSIMGEILSEYNTDISGTGTDGSRMTFGLYPSVSTPVMTLVQGGNVGIGTTSPDEKLHILDTTGANIILNSNTAAVSSGIYMSEGADATPTQNGAYLYYNGSTNTFNIATGSGAPTDKLTIARDTGNVGIGTTSPVRKLTVQGADSGYGQLRLMGTASQNSWWDIGRESASTGDFRFVSSRDGVERTVVTIEEIGNVGIGTSSPNASDSSAKTLQIGNSFIMQNVIGSQLLLSENAYYDGGWKYATTSEASAIRMWGGDIQFHSTTSGTAGNTITNWDSTDVRMIIENGTGNVGIGTTTPTNTLNVLGDANVTGTLYTNEIHNFGAVENHEFDGKIGGSAGWIKLGTLTLAQQGNNALIRMHGGSGYNADNAQNAYVDLYIRTSNGNSVDANGFCASAFATRYGQNNNFISEIKLVSNAQGCSASAYDVYAYTGTYLGEGWYSVDVGTGSWSDGMATATDPGSASNTTYVVPYEFRVQDTLEITGGDVGIGTTSPDDILDITTTNGQLLASDYGVLKLFRETAGDGGAALQFRKTDGGAIVTDNAVLGSLRWFGNDSLDIETEGARIEAKINGTPNSNTLPTDLIFYAASTGNDDLAEKMRIKGSGNVGIGTASPTAKLQVDAGSVDYVGAFVSDDDSYITLGTAVSGADNRLEMHYDAGGNFGSFRISGDIAPLGLNIANGGNVGIGTSTPTNLLNVLGDANVTGTLYTGTLEATTQSVTDLWVSNNATIGKNLSVDTNTLFVDSSTNNVGIGTTTPTSLLHLNKSTGESVITAESFDDNVALILKADVSNTATGYDQDPRVQFNSGETEEGYLIYDTSEDQFALGPSFQGLTPIMVWEDGGNVGIGTTSPRGDLEIADNGYSDTYISAYATNDVVKPRLYFLKSANDNVGTLTATADNEDLGLISFAGVNSGSAVSTGAYIFGEQEGATDATNIGGRMTFYTATKGSAPAERMRIESGGNVGIGDTDPETKLDVDGGNVSFDAGAFYWNYNDDRLGIGTTSPDNNLEVEGANAIGHFEATSSLSETRYSRSGTVYGRIAHRSSASSQYATDGFNVISHDELGLVSADAVGNISFHIGTENPSDEKMRLTFEGNLGIGTTSPDAKLHIGHAGYGGIKMDTLYDLSNGDSGVIEFAENTNADATTGISLVYAGAANPTIGGRAFTVPANTFNIIGNSGSSDVNAFTVERAGQVGIGTTTPTNLLNVLGDANVTGTLYAGTLNVGAMTVSGNLDMGNFIISNIGDANTDFDTNGGLNLVEDLDIEGDMDMATGKLITWVDNNQYISGTATGITIESDDTLAINADTSVTVTSPTLYASGEIQTPGAIGGVGDNIVHVAYPKGASLDGGTTSTGAIKITLPVTYTSTMMKMTVEIYDYANDESVTVKLGGYWYAGPHWTNTYAQIIAGRTDRDYNVRFGWDASNKGAIWIGETTSAWNHMYAIVTEFSGSHAGPTWANWADGWDMTVESVISGTQEDTESANFVMAQDVVCTDCLTATEIDDIYLFNDGDTASGNYTFDTSTLHIDSSANRVGIGTTSPSVKLHLNGSTYGASALRFSNDYGGNTDYWDVGERVAGAGDHYFSIEDSGTNRFTIDNAGNVGIGTTTPDYELDVEGNIGLNTNLQHNGDTDTYLAFVDDNMGAVMGGELLLNLYEGTQDYVKLGDGGDVDVNLNDDLFVEGLTGEVGIGDLSPETTLDVDGGNVSFDEGEFLWNYNNNILELSPLSSGDTTLALGDKNVAEDSFLRINAKDTMGGILFYETGVAGTDYIQYGGYMAYDEPGDDLEIGTFHNEASLAERITQISIPRGGGTTSFTYDIAVNGDDIYSDGQLDVMGVGYIRLGDTGTPTYATADDDVYVPSDLEVDANVYVAGNIGIGVGSPQAPLHVESLAALPTVILNRTSGYPSIKAGGDDNGYMLIESAGAGTGAVGLNWYNSDNVILAYGGGDVGIGDSTPDAKLDVYENLASSYAAIIDQDSNTGYGLQILTDSATAGDPILNVLSGSTSRFYVDADGEVGIGTTSPEAELEINGATPAIILGDGGTEDIEFTFDSYSANNFHMGVEYTWDPWLQIGSGLGVGDDDVLLALSNADGGVIAKSGMFSNGRVYCTNGFDIVGDTRFYCYKPYVHFVDNGGEGNYHLDYGDVDYYEAACLALGGTYGTGVTKTTSTGIVTKLGTDNQWYTDVSEPSYVNLLPCNTNI